MGRPKKPSNFIAWNEETIRNLIWFLSMEFSDQNLSRKDREFLQGIFSACQKYMRKRHTQYLKTKPIKLLKENLKYLIEQARIFQKSNNRSTLGSPTEWLFNPQTKPFKIGDTANALKGFITKDKGLSNDFVVEKLTEMMGLDYIERIMHTTSEDYKLRTPAAWAEHIIEKFGYGSRSVIRSAIKVKEKSSRDEWREVFNFLLIKIFPIKEEVRSRVMDIIAPHMEDIRFAVYDKQLESGIR